MLTNTLDGENIRKQFDELTLLPIPNGRELTKAEEERMWVHFLGHSWSMRLDEQGRIYLGGGEEENRNDEKTSVFYYVLATDVANLPLPKKTPKKNAVSPMLKGLKWYDKLMKNIK